MGFSIKSIFGKEELDETMELGEERNTSITGKMIVLEPRSFSEAKQIADLLKKKEGVIVKLRRVTPEHGTRIVDFLNGTLYALGGVIQKLDNGLFLCTPKNIVVEGQVSEDFDSSNSKKTEEDEFDY